MPKFRKKVVPVGTFNSREGQAVVTPARLSHWVNQFQAQKAEGLKIPVPWGHHPKADPLDPTQPNDFHNSRFNATYLDDLQVDDKGDLCMVAEVPPGLKLNDAGELVDEANHTVISEVSLAARDWTDGKGKTWKDSIRHVALTPLPVWHGQSGFAPVESPPAEGEQRLSMSLLAIEPAAPAPAPIINPGSSKPDDEARIMRLLEQLGRCGVQLPGDTNNENFLERLETGLSVLEAAKKAQATQQPVTNDPNAKPIQEQRANAMFMSLSDCKDPVTLALANEIARDKTQRRLDRIAALGKRKSMSGVAFLSPAKLKGLEDAATSVELSLSDGKLVEPEIDRTLTLLESILPAEQPGDLLLGSHEERKPQEQAQSEHLQRVTQEFQENVGLREPTLAK